MAHVETVDENIEKQGIKIDLCGTPDFRRQAERSL